MRLTIVDGDLLDQDVDVIVNAWNRNIIPWWLLIPQGVSGAIKRRAGIQPFRELAKHGPMRVGTAVVTSAGRLPFKAIIHVAGINMLWRSSEQSIRDLVRNAIAIAGKKELCIDRPTNDWRRFWRWQCDDNRINNQRRTWTNRLYRRGQTRPLRKKRNPPSDGRVFCFLLLELFWLSVPLSEGEDKHLPRHNNRPIW